MDPSPNRPESDRDDGDFLHRGSGLAAGFMELKPSHPEVRVDDNRLGEIWS